jgi:phosphatidylinositol alpha-mannosyltransferase
MKVLLTSPYSRKDVHRGTERYQSELAWWLAGRGHDVTLVTTAPAPRALEVDADGVTHRFVTAGPARGRGRLRVDELMRMVPPLAREVGRVDADIAQSHYYVDAAATHLGQRRLPYILYVAGVARRVRLGGKPLNRAAFAFACRHAARVHTISEFAARALQEDFGVRADVVTNGVRTDLYAGPKGSGGDEIILCTASPDDPRKHIEDLVEAFVVVARQRPSTRLLLVQPQPARGQRFLDMLPEDVAPRAQIRSASDDEIAALYRDAAVSVLPAVDEAFGLAIVESLAAGTPVVGAEHAAIPELLDRPEIGRLFPPRDVPALARAIVDALEMSTDPATASACRAAAQRWDWAQVGPQIEGIFADLAR